MPKSKHLPATLLAANRMGYADGYEDGVIETQKQITIRDQVIAELKVQLKDAQDELLGEICKGNGPSYSELFGEPEDDNGDYARGIRS